MSETHTYISGAGNDTTIWANMALIAALGYVILDSPPMIQEGWSTLGYLVPAAILLGIGSYVNGACVFGSVGHIGNGEVEFAFTFLGIYAVLFIESCFDLLSGQPPISASTSLGAVFLALALVAMMALRLSLSRRLKSHFRRLTMAMGSVGITSTIPAVLAPGFAIVASVGSVASIPVTGAVISVCMFGGSFVSARLRKDGFKFKRPAMKTIVKRTFAGIFMGAGALLIPGGNDTLLLVGLPAEAWQAVLAYLLFVATLAALILAMGSEAKPWS